MKYLDSATRRSISKAVNSKTSNHLRVRVPSHVITLPSPTWRVTAGALALSSVIAGGLWLALIARDPSAVAAPPSAGPDEIGICHASSSTVNPYNSQSPAKSADVQGHDGHNGPIFPLPDWGDIIPPFEFGDPV